MNEIESAELQDLRAYKAKCEEERKKILCIYCGAEFTKEPDEANVNAVAEHIFTCEKSPVVHVLNELCEKIMPLVDLWDSIRDGMGSREPVSIYLARNPEQLTAVVVALNALSKSLHDAKATNPLTPEHLEK